MLEGWTRFGKPFGERETASGGTGARPLVDGGHDTDPRRGFGPRRHAGPFLKKSFSTMNKTGFIDEETGFHEYDSTTLGVGQYLCATTDRWRSRHPRRGSDPRRSQPLAPEDSI